MNKPNQLLVITSLIFLFFGLKTADANIRIIAHPSVTVDKIKAKPSLNTKAALVDGTFFIASHTDYLIAASTQIYGAAHTAISTDCFDLLRCLPGIFGHEGSGGASLDTFTAGFTYGFKNGFIAKSTYSGRVASEG